MTARVQDYSVTRGHLQPGAVGVATPLGLTEAGLGVPEASIGLVALDDFDVQSAGVLLVDATHRINGKATGKPNL